MFTDPIPAGTTFASGSVKINGVVYAAYDPQVGFALPDLAVGDIVIVEFDVTVNRYGFYRYFSQHPYLPHIL